MLTGLEKGQAPEAFLAGLGEEIVHRARAFDPAGLFDSQALERLLNLTSVWTGDSLKLFVDGRPVLAQKYCAPALDQTGRTVARPNPDKVMGWLKEGASLILNDVDQLDPNLAAMRALLQRATGARAQANLYYSRAERQAFPSHFDSHDVLALHCEGDKLWRIYANREPWPINHAAWQAVQAEAETRKGPVRQEVLLAPGDLLYLPRGQWHDALAAHDGALHVSFGLTRPIGLDALAVLWDRAAADPEFRQPLPTAPPARAEHLRHLAARLAELSDARSLAAVDEMLRGWPYPDQRYRLPEPVPVDAAPRPRIKGSYITTSADFRLVRTRDGRIGLQGPRGAVEIPPGFEAPSRWVIEQGAFEAAELAARFPALDTLAFVNDLVAMKVIRASF